MEDGDCRRGGQRCDKINIGYEGDCARCAQKYTYIGETSRTAYTRIKEHYSNYRSAAAARLPALSQEDGDSWVWSGGGHRVKQRKQDVQSWMWEHCRDVHGGQVGEEGGMRDYKFSVTGTFRKPLLRQIDEGLRLDQCEGEILNSKNEYFTPKIVVPEFRQL